MFFSKRKTVNEELVSLHLPYPDKEDRLVRVYVPEHKKGEKLPVIYMTDGQSIFDEESNPWGCWHTREAVKAEYESSGRKAIIVGIHSPRHPLLRTNELTPKSIGSITLPEIPPPMPEGMPPMPEGMPPMPEGMPPMPEGAQMTPEMLTQMMEEMQKMFSPEGEIFDNFLIKTVMPEVEAKFPVKKGRANTAICGSSSGGLESFYIALVHPERFCAAGIFSPAFIFYSTDDIKTWVKNSLQKKTPFLYIYCGQGEEKEKEMCDQAKPIFDLLKDSLPQKMIKEVILPDAIHNEAAWEPIFKDFLHIFLTEGKKF